MASDKNVMCVEIDSDANIASGEAEVKSCVRHTQGEN